MCGGASSLEPLSFRLRQSALTIVTLRFRRDVRRVFKKDHIEKSCGCARVAVQSGGGLTPGACSFKTTLNNEL